MAQASQASQAPHERWPTAFPDPPRPPVLVVFQAPAPGDAWDIPKDPTKGSAQWMVKWIITPVLLG